MGLFCSGASFGLEGCSDEKGVSLQFEGLRCFVFVESHESQIAIFEDICIGGVHDTNIETRWQKLNRKLSRFDR